LGTTWFDITASGVVSSDTAGLLTGQTGIASFLDKSINLDFDNVMATYIRAKVVTTTSTNTISIKNKKRSY
jgi:hypothetical protein